MGSQKPNGTSQAGAGRRRHIPPLFQELQQQASRSPTTGAMGRGLQAGRRQAGRQAGGMWLACVFVVQAPQVLECRGLSRRVRQASYTVHISTQWYSIDYVVC